MSVAVVLYPQAVCEARELLCPGCGCRLVGPMTTRTEGVLVTCHNQERRVGTRRAGRCGQHAVVIPGAGDTSTVVAVPPEVFRRLMDSAGAFRAQLRLEGIIVSRNGP